MYACFVSAHKMNFKSEIRFSNACQCGPMPLLYLCSRPHTIQPISLIHDLLTNFFCEFTNARVESMLSFGINNWQTTTISIQSSKLYYDFKRISAYCFSWFLSFFTTSEHQNTLTEHISLAWIPRWLPLFLWMPIYTYIYSWMKMTA